MLFRALRLVNLLYVQVVGFWSVCEAFVENVFLMRRLALPWSKFSFLCGGVPTSVRGLTYCFGSLCGLNSFWCIFDVLNAFAVRRARRRRWSNNERQGLAAQAWARARLRSSKKR